MSESVPARCAVVVRHGASEVPLLAGVVEHGFSAITSDGWSTVVLDEPADAAVIAATSAKDFCVAVTSDGVRRSLTVYPAADGKRGVPGEASHQQAMGAVATLTWDEPTSDAPSGGSGTQAPTGGTTVGTASAEQGTKVSVEAIASVCDLDPAATSRLENYATSSNSSLVLESVLQLLGVPVIAAKLVESQRELKDYEDARCFEPRSTGLSMLDAVLTPRGNDVLSRLYRTGLRHPNLLLAVSGAEVAARTALAVAASRGGRASRALGAASALLFTDAAGQTALWAAVRARKKS